MCRLLFGQESSGARNGNEGLLGEGWKEKEKEAGVGGGGWGRQPFMFKAPHTFLNVAPSTVSLHIVHWLLRHRSA